MTFILFIAEATMNDLCYIEPQKLIQAVDEDVIDLLLVST